MGNAWNTGLLALAFASELAALAALAFWGWTVPDSTLPRVRLAVGTSMLAAVLWGVFAAPQAPVRVLALAALVKLLVFGSAVAALAATGHPWLAVALAVAAAAGSLLSTPPEPSAHLSCPAAG